MIYFQISFQKNIFIHIGSCNQADSKLDIDKRTRKITHRINELFNLIKDNQSDR